MQFKNNTKNYLNIIFIILFASAISGCKKDDAKPGTNEVWMQNTAFTPGSITVAVNTTITWTNKDGTNHTVTSDSTLFDSGSIGNGGTFSHQFTVAGTFSYHCKIHSGMTGMIIVH